MADTVSLHVRLTNYYKVRDALMAKQNLYRGAFRDTIKRMLMEMRNYAHFITHRETGVLAASHDINYNPRRLSGYVYPSDDRPKLVGRRTQYPSEYGTYEHARGGDHAFYQRALDERGHEVGMGGVNMMIDYLS